MPGFNKNIIDNVESAMTSRLEEHQTKRKLKGENNSTEVTKKKEQKNSNQKIITNSDNQKKKAKNDFSLGARVSRVERAYESGMIPTEHYRVYEGLKRALGEKTSGELILQRVLDDIGMFRSSVLRIIQFLVRYGYIEYESRTHHIFVRILK